MNDRNTPEGSLEERVSALERAVDALAERVVTRRLAVVDERGVARIVGTVDGTAAEFTLRLGDGSAEVVVYADPGALPGAGAAVGIQLRAGGDAVAELDAAAGRDGRWRATLVRKGVAAADGRVNEAPTPLRSPRAVPPPPPARPGPIDSPG